MCGRSYSLGAKLQLVDEVTACGRLWKLQLVDEVTACGRSYSVLTKLQLVDEVTACGRSYSLWTLVEERKGIVIFGFDGRC